MDDMRTLGGAWAMRNAAAAVLTKAEEQMHLLLADATAEQLVELVESFSPTRSPGPEWSRTFDPLVERIWSWASPPAIASVEEHFRARGPVWAAVANAFTASHGEQIAARLAARPGARLPALTLA